MVLVAVHPEICNVQIVNKIRAMQNNFDVLIYLRYVPSAYACADLPEWEVLPFHDHQLTPENLGVLAGEDVTLTGGYQSLCVKQVYNSLVELGCNIKVHTPAIEPDPVWYLRTPKDMRAEGFKEVWKIPRRCMICEKMDYHTAYCHFDGVVAK